jgi:hypothetical protein
MSGEISFIRIPVTKHEAEEEEEEFFLGFNGHRWQSGFCFF